MNKEDFTEDELRLLKMIFDAAEAAIYSDYDNMRANDFFHIKEKLGIYDLLNK